jgi:hypothetical protein
VRSRFGSAGFSGYILEGLQLFAGLEADGFARWDADLLAGAGIAADAGLAGFDVEDAKAAQLDAFAAAESVLHGFEDGLDGLFGFGTGDVSLLDDCIYDIELNHKASRLSRKSMLDMGLQVVKPWAVL